MATISTRETWARKKTRLRMTPTTIACVRSRATVATIVAIIVRIGPLSRRAT